MFLPMYIIPLIATIGSDYIMYKNNNKFIQKHKNKIAGSILGSVFFMPASMLGMTFLEIYVYNDVFPYRCLAYIYRFVDKYLDNEYCTSAIAEVLEFPLHPENHMLISNLNQVLKIQKVNCLTLNRGKMNKLF